METLVSPHRATDGERVDEEDPLLSIDGRQVTKDGDLRVMRTPSSSQISIEGGPRTTVAPSFPQKAIDRQVTLFSSQMPIDEGMGDPRIIVTPPSSEG